MNHPNITAYENVERFDSFSKKQFEDYCNLKINDCSKHVHFIKKHILNFRNNIEKPKICEIGSGNSKLLYALEKNKLISSGIGYELSKSRVNFANKFREFTKSKIIKNINQDFLLDKSPLNSPFDLIIGVDIVLQLISPINTDQEKKALEWLRKNLKTDGYLILELWSLSNYIDLIEKQDGIFRRWESYSAEDPWEFCLAEVSRMENGDIIWDKTFLKRNKANERSFFRNILRPYSKEQISKLLKKYGFEVIKFFDYWETPNDSVEEEYIVLAK